MRHIWTLSLLLSFTQASFAQLSGSLSGTLGPGVFHVVDTIFVEAGDSLTLLPGTAFTFDGPFPFRIYGTLLAEGTASDSLVFTTDILTNPDRWRGLRFSGSGCSGSRLVYCIIEYGYATGSEPNDCGGGIACYDGASPEFTCCTIAHNQADAFGGGVDCGLASPIFTNCIISGNSANAGGDCDCFPFA